MRAAFAMELQESLGFDAIARREGEAAAYAYTRLSACPHLVLMGEVTVASAADLLIQCPRGPVLLGIPRSIAALLNDLFGIQSRLFLRGPVRTSHSPQSPHHHGAAEVDHVSTG